MENPKLETFNLALTRSAMSKWAKGNHKRSAKVLGYALTIGGYKAWADAGRIWRALLDDGELVALAYTTLRTLTPEDAHTTATAALPRSLGQPIASLFNHMNEAALWSDMAEAEELEAYCLASFTATPQSARQLSLTMGGKQ